MGFVKNNIVAIVMIPSIIGMHYGWTSLQSNKKLVPDHPEITEQPIFTVAKRTWAHFFDGDKGSAK